MTNTKRYDIVFWSKVEDYPFSPAGEISLQGTKKHNHFIEVLYFGMWISLVLVRIFYCAKKKMMEVFLIKELTINEGIRAKEVRLISDSGEQLGIVAYDDALSDALDQGLDLVLMSPNAKPPVCKIMDYGKYRFEQSKREKEAKKKQNVIEIKEVRLSPSIEEHDINVRVKNARKFLKQGNKVKVSIRFKGRQMAHTKLGFGVMNDFAQRLGDECVVETRPKLEGRNMMMMLSADVKKK